MKIIYIANVRMPTEKAHGYQIMRMCQAFTKKGIEVELLIPDRKNSINQDEFSYYALSRSFKIKRLPCLSFELFGTRLQSISFFLLAKFYLFRRKYDHLYSRDYQVNLFFGNAILELHQLPLRISYFCMHCIGRANLIFTTTNCLKKEIVEKINYNKHVVKVLPSGIDIEKYDIKDSMQKSRNFFNIPAGSFVIGYCGKFNTMGMDKGVADIIATIPRVRKPQVYFFAIGASDEGEIRYYEKLAMDYGVANIVKIIKHVSISHVPRALKACNVLVMSYSMNKHYDCYMSPVKMFEYMASKRPIISADLCSIREVLNDQSAIFYSPKNNHSLLGAINYAINNPDVLMGNTENAFELVRKYSWENRVDAVIGEL